MKGLIVLLLTLCGIAAAQTTDSNSLEGLPQYGVTLSGSLENPIVENHSGKTVIGYVVKFADANGRGEILNQLMAHSPMLPAGIPDGGSLYAKGAVPVNSNARMPSPPQVRSAGQGPIVSVTLKNVVFGDGQFVGPNEHEVFENFGLRIKAIRELGILAKTGAWDQLDALALSPGARSGPLPSGEDPRTYFERRSIATRLVQEWKFKGDAAASQLAEIYASLPTLFK